MSFGNMSNLLDDFVDMIQTNINSSVHTVLNTGEKIEQKYSYKN